ncbi:MAG: hypothetical protein AB8H47_10990 [Bacteroidia bacterium]
MPASLKENFIAKLEDRYGAWNEIRSKFGATSFGVISRDLSISASQFSKLISGTATEGMYQRSIENIDRLIEEIRIKEELGEIKTENAQLQANLSSLQSAITRSKLYWLAAGLIGALVLGLIVMAFWDRKPNSRPPLADNAHPLAAFFDQDFQANFNSPYLDLSEVQAYCPCSAYEGVWELDKTYKLPLPGSGKPGLYYLSRSADVRMKCSRYDTLKVGKGRVLMGYEYLINEIWVDKTMAPLSPLYFDKGSKRFTQAFEDLNFDQEPNFAKVATIHSFFIDKFELYDDSIVRRGEPYGRFATDIDEALAQQYEVDVKYILEQVVGNLTTTNCAAAINPFCDPNDLKAGQSSINFECLYTIRSENMGIGGGYPYEKGYRLQKQAYADNLTCDCAD